MVQGKRVLVLGGGGAGIGRAIVRRLGDGGACVVVADLQQDRAEDAAAELTERGAIAWPIWGDVCSADELHGIIRAAVDLLGGLDGLVTVVGGQVAFVPAVKLHEMTDEDWDTVYEVNLRYVARAVRQTLSILLDQGKGGAIVSVGSVTGFMAAPQQAAYGVAKAGLLSLARTVAAEYAADQIRMNVVAGGAISTGVANTALQEWVDEVPLGRYGTSDEMADAALYLLSDASAYITGQQIVIDGGVSVRGPFS
jgi:3-oxoacyl-[acyl-carrier protein] reductase